MNASTSTERSELENAPADLRTIGERPTDAELTAARVRITAALAPTPVVAARSREAWLKLENLQITGSFKVRGALNAIALGVEMGDRRSIVAASAGNHGLGVAWAARRFGLSACVVVPCDAPRAKVEGCRALGAEVVVGGEGFEACWAAAHRLATERGARLVHAFDDPDVIAGQATVGFEIAALAPDVVLVPVGGGGLAAGVGVEADRGDQRRIRSRIAPLAAANGHVQVSSTGERTVDGWECRCEVSLSLFFSSRLAAAGRPRRRTRAVPAVEPVAAPVVAGAAFPPNAPTWPACSRSRTC